MTKNAKPPKTRIGKVKMTAKVAENQTLTLGKSSNSPANSGKNKTPARLRRRTIKKGGGKCRLWRRVREADKTSKPAPTLQNYRR